MREKVYRWISIAGNKRDPRSGEGTRKTMACLEGVAETRARSEKRDEEEEKRETRSKLTAVEEGMREEE